MEIYIEQPQLLLALDRVMGAVGKSNTIPILSHVLLYADDEQLTVTATDLEVQLKQTVPCQVMAPMQITCNAKKLRDIAKSLPENATVSIKLDPETEKLTVKAKRSRFTLATLPALDYPSIVLNGDPLSFTFGANELRNALNRIAPAMAKEDVRYYLNGALFDFIVRPADPEDELAEIERECVIIATDGHRLVKTNVSTADIKDSCQFIVCRRAIELLEKLTATKGLVSVKVAFAQNGIEATIENTVLTSKLLDGKYPEYARVIPPREKVLAEVNRNDFIASLNRVVVMSHEKSKGCKLSFQNGTLECNASNASNESSIDAIDLTYDGEPVTIGFSINYLLDALGSMDAKDVTLSFVDSNNSMLLFTDDMTMYVIMPMRM